jgi:uncharacterized protein with GYD domain
MLSGSNASPRGRPSDAPRAQVPFERRSHRQDHFRGPRAPQGETSMATYIVLSSFTDQGVRNVKDTTKRADAVRETAKKMGVTMKDIYWTVGKYDVVVTFDAPDDAAMTALSLAISSGGNVRTQTMRAFSRDEVAGILAKL